MKLKPIFIIMLALGLTANAQAQTKKLYGVQGAQLSYHKQSNQTHSYVVRGVTYTTRTKDNAKSYHKEGVASYYANKFNGRRTASGEPYNSQKYTAAHKTLPLQSYVLVTNLRNHRKVIVRINDRGPFHGNRIIDLSRSAAKEIGMLASGTARVKVEALHVSPQGKISGAGATSLLKTASKQGSEMIVGSQEKLTMRITNISNRQQAENLLKQLPFKQAKTEIKAKGNKFDIIAGPFADKAQINQIKIKLNKLDKKQHLVVYTYN